MPRIELSDAARTALRTVRIEDNRLYLEGQLDRKVYVEVNKVLEAAGAKWDRKAKAHLFNGDPAETINTALEEGLIPRKNPLSFYPTPKEVVRRMTMLVPLLDTGQRVLEPSAGYGAIAEYLVNCGLPQDNLTLVEIDRERAKWLRFEGYNVEEVDFLKWEPEEYFDRVYMNPPFTVEGNATAWIDHVYHAYSMLRPGGALCSVVPAGILFREDSRHARMRDMARFGKIEELPEGSFKESGTDVFCCLLILIKPGGGK